MTAKPTVLVPMARGLPARRLIDLARALAGDADGRAIVLSVVVVPEERPLSEAVALARRRREALRRLGGPDEGDLEFSVRAAHSVEQGIREAVRENQVDTLLLGWRGPMRSEERFRRSALDALILDPPCDVSVFKDGWFAHQGRPESPLGPTSILVPVRGGPHAELALHMAQALAQHYDAWLSVLRIRGHAGDGWSSPDLAAFLGLLNYSKTRLVEPVTDDVESAIRAESSRHQLLILGASARGPRTTRLLGTLPERLADAVSCPVMVVKTAKPLLPEMFGLVSRDLHSGFPAGKSSISTVVDQWFAENTFHSHEFANLRRLLRLKESQEVTISLALPALDEEATIGRIISTIKGPLMDELPVLDEMVVIDSDSRDRTREIAEGLGIPVHSHAEILPEAGSHVGKGEALWKSLHVTHGDIVIWIDSDITDIHPKFVYGLLGPLLTQPRVDFVKGYYRRPLRLGQEMLTTGGGRVTELTARPLINLFYPQLSGLVQPLAGEMAGRRELLEQLPFFTGYGVETGLLIDILERFGLSHIAQTDLENRIHRNQDMSALSKMAFGIVQVVMRRLEDRQHIRLLDEINTTMKLIHYSPEELFLEVKEIQEYERPPIIDLEEYVAQRRKAESIAVLEPAE